MGVSIQKLPDGRVNLNIRHKSLPKGRLCKRVKGKDAADALKKARLMKRQIDARIELKQPLFDEDQAGAKSGGLTLSEYYQLHFKQGHFLDVSEKTRVGYENSWRWIEPRLGHLALNQISRQDVKHFVSLLKQQTFKRTETSAAEPLARDTVRIIKNLLQKILEEAFDSELVEKNPASRLKVRYQELPVKHRINPLNEAEAKLFCEKAASLTPWYFPLFACMLHAGLRPGEAVALRRNDVDFENRVLHVRATISNRKLGKTTKTGRSRAVEMSDFLHDVLVSLFAEQRERWGDDLPDSAFCTVTGARIDTHNVRVRHLKKVLDAMKAELKKRDFSGWSLHQLRHTFASLHIQQSGDIAWVSRQLGHSDISTTYRHYYHYLPENQKAKYNNVLPSIKIERTENAIPFKIA